MAKTRSLKRFTESEIMAVLDQQLANARKNRCAIRLIRMHDEQFKWNHGYAYKIEGNFLHSICLVRRIYLFVRLSR